MTDPAARARLAAWLRSPQGAACLAAAGAAMADAVGDPLAAGTSVRRRFPDLDVARAAAALEQAELRTLAADRYGIASADLLLTRDGLEQATRPEVARRRADLLRSTGVRRVVDATGGLGLDTGAFLAAGLVVTSVERDPATAAFLAHNCPGARVVVADITDPPVLGDVLAQLTPTDALFVDPARRDPVGPRETGSGRSRPERDPERWSPPWSFVAGVRHPRVVAKLAPGFKPPDDWHAEWTSIGRTVVECAVFSWPAFASSRRAVIIAGGRDHVFAADPDAARPPLAEAPDRWLHEPDPALIRAAAIPALVGAHPGLRSLGPDSTWLTSDHVPAAGPALRSHRLVAELVGSLRQQRRQLADLQVTRLTVKSRDVDADPRVVLRRLALPEGPRHVLVMTRLGSRAISLLVEPARPRSA